MDRAPRGVPRRNRAGAAAVAPDARSFRPSTASAPSAAGASARCARLSWTSAFWTRAPACAGSASVGTCASAPPRLLVIRLARSRAGRAGEIRTPRDAAAPGATVFP